MSTTLPLGFSTKIYSHHLFLQFCTPQTTRCCNTRAYCTITSNNIKKASFETSYHPLPPHPSFTLTDYGSQVIQDENRKETQRRLKRPMCKVAVSCKTLITIASSYASFLLYFHYFIIVQQIHPDLRPYPSFPSLPLFCWPSSLLPSKLAAWSVINLYPSSA